MNELLDEEVKEDVSRKTKAAESNKKTTISSQQFNKDEKYKSAVLNDPLSDFKLDKNNTQEFGSINHTINVASLGPGNILKNAREQANLSRDDIAKELRLAARHIEYLEQDAYHKFTAVAFYIGYVRNYSRLLELDPDKMVSKFYAVYKVTPDVGVSKYNQVKTSAWKDSWLMSFLFGMDKTPAEKAKNTKIMAVAVAVVVLFMFIWYLAAGSASGDHMATAVNVEQLPPEKVDELLPSAPVIVKNTEQESKIKHAASKSDIKKKAMLDKYS